MAGVVRSVTVQLLARTRFVNESRSLPVDMDILVGMYVCWETERGSTVNVIFVF